MFGCSDETSLPDDAEALAAPPQGEGFGLVPRICYSLLHRLQEANEGNTVNLGKRRYYWARGWVLAACKLSAFSCPGLETIEGAAFPLLPCHRGPALYRIFEVCIRANPLLCVGTSYTQRHSEFCMWR